MRGFTRLLAVLVPVCSLLPPLAASRAAAADPHPFSVRDLVVLRRMTEPRPAPDGKRVAYVLRTTDLEANRGRTDIWLVDLAGGAPRQLTTGPENESNPRWSPDGSTLYFLSTRGGGPQQVFALPMAGGEARAVTSLPLDVGSFEVSPDGTRLLVALEVFADCPTVKCTTDRAAEQEKKKATGKIYDQLMVRHWDEWEDGRRSHLFVVPVAGGEPIDLMKGMDADAPGKPFGGPEEYTFTPDGKAVVFTAKDVGREAAWSTNHDLFLAPADGSAAPRNLTAANKAWDVGPVFAPDGRTLYYRAMTRPGYEADRFRIIARAWPDGAEREVAPKWDRSPGEMAISADGRTLFVTADNLGNHALFAIDVKSGAARPLMADGNTSSPLAAGSRLVTFTRDSLKGPADLFTVRPDGSGLTQVTKVNADLLEGVRFGEPEPFTFTGAQGATVYGWVVKPADFDPAKKYPIAFLIHGGPQGSFGNDFHYRWNPQTYAGGGFAAVFIDFHGSTGYGQAFTDAIRGDWGGKPLEDLQKGLAFAIAKYPFLDGQRACALGASYGGYMINWISGAWPDRFKCLVTHDGNFDERMAYFDTEELWFPEWEHEGTPWEKPESYTRHNPVDLVAKWQTPILVIHGGRDYRVVETHGIAVFNAAQRRGVPSRMLYFPDENHWVLKPHNSILWHDTVLDWLRRWTK